MPDPAKLSFAVPAFNSYKEYSWASSTITINGTVPSGQIATFSQTLILPRANSVASIEFSTSVNSDLYVTGMTYTLLPDTNITHSNGSTPTFPGTAPYIIFFQNNFVGDSVTVAATVTNLNAETLTVVTEILTFGLYTFIAPFKSL